MEETESQTPWITTFIVFEVILITLNIYFLYKILQYYKFMKGENTQAIDWYLVATFLTLSGATFLRSSTNLILNIMELIY